MRRGGEPESVWRSVAGQDAEYNPTPDDPGDGDEDRCRNRHCVDRRRLRQRQNYPFVLWCMRT